MPFTNAELRDVYTDLNIGSPGPAVDQAAVDAIAAQTRAGLISDQQALQAVYDLVDDTTGVAALTYQFFTGSLPTYAGFQFLVNSATNANDLNDPYYAQFNAENRFINFSFNLALGTPANQSAFAAVYGAASLEDVVRVAYDTIVGNAAAAAAGIDVEEAIDFLTGPDQVAFYRAIATSRGGVSPTDTVRLDLAIKAIAIAELLYAAAQEDVGNYASALNQFYASLADGSPDTSPGFNSDLLETFPPTATVTLTPFADTLTGNVFNAPRAFTPGGNDQVNTLNDDDVLTGVGDNPTLNFTFVNDTDSEDVSIAPTLNGIETINVDVRLDANAALDLQDATGVTNVNLRGIDGADFLVDSIQSVVDMSITDSNADSDDISFLFDRDAVGGTSDEADLALDDAQVNKVFVVDDAGGTKDGIENLNLILDGGANSIGQLVIEDAQKLTITGDADLSLGTTKDVSTGALAVPAPGLVAVTNGIIEASVRNAGLGQVAGSLTTIDATAATGDLEISLGAETVSSLDGKSGVPVDFKYLGGAGNDTVWLTAGINKGDVIDGNGGDNTVGVYASVEAGSVVDVQSLIVHAGNGVATGAVLTPTNTITVDTALFTELADVTVRNIGNNGTISGPVNATVNLTKLSATVAADIAVEHGTTGNNGLNNLLIATTFKAPSASDTLGVSIEEGVNVDPRFNFKLQAVSAENLTFTDADTESNTVQLAAASLGDHTGTVKIVGGEAGDFLNLDATGKLYNYDTTGGVAGDLKTINDIGNAAAERLVAKVIDAADAVSDVIVRVTNTADLAGAQTIKMGAGNDTVIFDAITGAGAGTAGFSVSDTVSGGDGKDTLAIDGHGVIVQISDSEWTNTTGFETIRLVGNGLTTGLATDPGGALPADTYVQAGDFGRNAYNLKLSDDLIEQNGVSGIINIINDNDPTNEATGGAGVNTVRGVTIDGTLLSSKNNFTYNGEEGASATADRFRFSDAGINGMAVIDGGFATLNTKAGNADVLEVVNSATVTIGDLANLKNIGTIEFTNELAVTQNSVLQLNNAVIDALVNSSHAAAAGDEENLKIVVAGNPNVIGAGNNLTIDTTGVTGTAHTYTVTVEGTSAVTIQTNGAAGAGSTINGDAANNNITGGSGNDTIDGKAGNDVLNGGAGNDTITGGEGADTVDGGAGADSIILTETVPAADVVVQNLTNTVAGTTLANADLITGFAVATDVMSITGPANLRSPGAAPADVALTAGDDIAAAQVLTEAVLGTTALNAAGFNGRVVYEATTAIAGDFQTQAGITAAVTAITTAYAANAVANTDMLFVLYDTDGDAAIFRYQEGAADAGIAAGELSLVNVLVGVGAGNLGDVNFS